MGHNKYDENSNIQEGKNKDACSNSKIINSIDKKFYLVDLNSPPKKLDINHIEILERLNNFIKKNKIKKEDFIESDELFVSKEDFKALFKKIRFDLSIEEINFLFFYNNQYSSNEFIRMKNFLQLYELEFTDYKNEKLLTEKNCILKINQDFKNLHTEILDIIKNDMKENDNGKNQLKMYNNKQAINQKLINDCYNNFSNRPLSAISNIEYYNNSSKNIIKDEKAPTSRKNFYDNYCLKITEGIKTF